MLLRTDTLRSSLRQSRGKQTPTTLHPEAEKRYTYKQRGPARRLRELPGLLFTTYYHPRGTVANAPHRGAHFYFFLFRQIAVREVGLEVIDCA